MSFIPIGIRRYCYIDICHVQRYLSWRNTQSVPFEGWFQYEKANSHCGDQIIFPSAYPHNGISHNAMLVKRNLCGNGPLLSLTVTYFSLRNNLPNGNIVSSGSGFSSLLTGVGYNMVRFPDIPFVYTTAVLLHLRPWKISTHGSPHSLPRLNDPGFVAVNLQLYSIPKLPP